MATYVPLTRAKGKPPRGAPLTFNDYACVDHPTLSPEAWAEVDTGWPKKDGIAAHLTCRFVCRNYYTCPITEGASTIAGRGWFTRLGEFREQSGEYIDVVFASVFLGVRKDGLLTIIRDNNYVSKMVGGRRMMLVSDMMDLVKSIGPRHGTVARYHLHILHGQSPCAWCTAAYTNPAQEQPTCESSSKQN